MSAWHNEIEAFPAQWTRNLIAGGHIAPGVVDERSIVEVQPDDLRGFAQTHFFCGIGGWPYALRLAGWPEHRPVWTGSCPCQPFSVAGKQRGFDDERHLWPHFLRLIAECRPPTIFGEQVAGASDWLRLVRSDLEALGYAVGAIPMEAASADADHFRDRYWFVAHRQDDGRQNWDAGSMEGAAIGGRAALQSERRSCGNPFGHVAHDDGELAGKRWAERGREFCGSSRDPQDRRSPLADSDSERLEVALCQPSDVGPKRQTVAGDRVRHVVNDPSLGWGEGWTEHEFRSRGFTAAVASIDGRQFVECPDGKWRRLPPPRVRWLGNGIPARVAKLRAFGNAIDPRAAAQFVAAFMECHP